jgi:hypothetical protein
MTARTKSERGSALVEFGLSMAFLLPILLALVAFGINLGNLLQSTQIVRDVDHMYAQGVDFSQTANQNIAVNLVQGLGGMTTSGGNGVIILSQIIQVYAADCTAGGYTTSQCTNLGSTVFLNRLVIGNSSLRASNYGTPTASFISAGGNIGSTDYLAQAADKATGFTTVLSPNLTAINGSTAYLADNQIAYVVEGYFASPTLNFLDWDTASAAGLYTVSIF